MSSASPAKPGSARSASSRSRKPAGREDPHAPRGLELVAQVVAEGHEVDEVVRVQVADDDGLEGARIDAPGDPGEASLAQVQADPAPVVLDHVGARRRAGAVRVGGAGSDDEEVHGSAGYRVRPGSRTVDAFPLDGTSVRACRAAASRGTVPGSPRGPAGGAPPGPAGWPAARTRPPRRSRRPGPARRRTSGPRWASEPAVTTVASELPEAGHDPRRGVRSRRAPGGGRRRSPPGPCRSRRGPAGAARRRPGAAANAAGGTCSARYFFT